MYELSVWAKDGQFAPQTISKKNFVEFLELCYKNATFFSLSKALWTTSTCEGLQSALEPLLVKEISTPKWFGYDYTKASKMEDWREITVYLYKANSEAKDILLNHCSDIFLRTTAKGTLKSSLETIEDLCFFIQETLFVGTVSHEYILGVYPPNEEFKNFMHKLGEWNYIDQIPIQLQEKLNRPN